jgi:hypothetical protein
MEGECLMGIGRTNTGGGVGMNFRVIGSTSQPTFAKENDIWVNTDKIESYVFSATEPESPVAGMVWFEVGPDSSVAFNALKKNAVYVYPVFCKQYVNGAWEDRFAHIYTQGGEWVQFSEVITNYYLYNLGDSFDLVTGGWEAKGTSDGQYAKAKAPTVTNKGTSIHLKTDSSDQNDWAQGVYRTKNKIDLTGYNTVNINAILSSGDGGRQLCIMDDSSYVAVIAIEVGVTSLDISSYNNGSYYVGVCMRPNAGWKSVTCEYDAIWLGK